MLVNLIPIFRIIKFKFSKSDNLSLFFKYTNMTDSEIVL